MNVNGNNCSSDIYQTANSQNSQRGFRAADTNRPENKPTEGRERKRKIDGARGLL